MVFPQSGWIWCLISLFMLPAVKQRGTAATVRRPTSSALWPHFNAGNAIRHRISIALRLHYLKDATKFTLLRHVSGEKPRRLQEESDNPIQSFPWFQPRSEATWSSCVANRFPNLNSRSTVCCHKIQLCLLKLPKCYTAQRWSCKR